MQRHEDVVLNQIGTPIPGVTITVRVQNATPGSGALATIYSDDGSTVISGSAVTTDTHGRFFFFVPDGKYDLTVTGTGVTTYTLADIEIADVTERFSSDLGWVVDTQTVGKWNSINVVDGSKFTTTQLALDDLSGNGFVLVPPGYAGADPTSIGAGESVIDLTTGELRIFTDHNDLYDRPMFQVDQDGILISTDSTVAGELNLWLRRNGPSTAGRGALVRFQSRNDLETLMSGVEIDAGLQFIDNGNEKGACAIKFMHNGSLESITFSSDLGGLTPATTGMFSLGTTSLGWTALNLESATAPIIRIEETDQTLPDGAWRLVGDGNRLDWQKNTAAGGDFSTQYSMLEFDTNGSVVVNQDANTAVDFRVEGLTDPNLFRVDASTDGIGMYGATPVAQASASANLTGTPGTANGAMATISGSGDDTSINNNFQECLEKINDILTAIRDLGVIA